MNDPLVSVLIRVRDEADLLDRTLRALRGQVLDAETEVVVDLGSLAGPLSRGRIAATVDESSVDYYLALGSPRSGPITAMLPSAGSGGPLLQGGLPFTNPTDDGGIYDRYSGCQSLPGQSAAAGR